MIITDSFPTAASWPLGLPYWSIGLGTVDPTNWQSANLVTVPDTAAFAVINLTQIVHQQTYHFGYTYKGGNASMISVEAVNQNDNRNSASFTLLPSTGRISVFFGNSSTLTGLVTQNPGDIFTCDITCDASTGTAVFKRNGVTYATRTSGVPDTAARWRPSMQISLAAGSGSFSFGSLQFEAVPARHGSRTIKVYNGLHRASQHRTRIR